MLCGLCVSRRGFRAGSLPGARSFLYACRTIFTPALVPMRVAPAATIAIDRREIANPARRFDSHLLPTKRRISATSATVAPPGPKPVDVLTKSAPAALREHARRDFLVARSTAPPR